MLESYSLRRFIVLKAIEESIESSTMSCLLTVIVDPLIWTVAYKVVVVFERYEFDVLKEMEPSGWTDPEPNQKMFSIKKKKSTASTNKNGLSIYQFMHSILLHSLVFEYGGRESTMSILRSVACRKGISLSIQNALHST